MTTEQNPQRHPYSTAPKDGRLIGLWAEDVGGPFPMRWDANRENPMVGPVRGLWVMADGSMTWSDHDRMPRRHIGRKFMAGTEETHLIPAGVRTPLDHGAPAYTIRVERLDYAGKTQSFEFDGYGVLRELMDDIESEAEKRGWFEDADKS